MALHSTSDARVRPAIVAIGPAFLLAAFAYHPYLDPPTDSGVIAGAAAADTTRWAFSHLAIAGGYGLLVIAFTALRSYLRDVDEGRWSARALPFIVMGGTLFAVLTGMEFAVLAAVETGADARAAQEALRPWFIPILLGSGLSFAIGALGFAAAIARSGVLGPASTRLVVGALIVMAISRFVPLSWAPYVLGMSGILALWPLAYEMAERGPARRSRAVLSRP